MKTTFEINAEMEAKLKTVGIPFESIKVFGVIHQNIHIQCTTLGAAEKWASVLARVLKGGKVSTVKTAWEAKKNQGSQLCPTMRQGFLVSVAA